MEQVDQWRCFHCDEVFCDRESAALHFGDGSYYRNPEQQQPACTIDIAEVRRLQNKEARYADEDADIHRTMHRQANEHVQALRRGEEAGYARGLRDSGKCPCASSEREADK